VKAKNITKTKAKIEEICYDKLSLKNEDNSYFDVTPLVNTNLGYFPITAIHKINVNDAVRVNTKNYFIDVVKNDHTLLCTNEEQPYWVNIRDLKLGDNIMTITGQESITSIEDIKTNNRFFDFRVDPTHSYFTNGIVSHNSMIALSMMREPSIDLIVYMDTEGGGVTKDFANFLGINTKKVLYTPVDTVEDLIKRMEKVIDTIEKNKSTKSVLMVIDSWSMLTTERERDPNGGADMGAKAKLSRQFFRTYARKMQRLNIACVMTAHLTETIGGYGPSKVVAGGTIMGYMPSIEVRFAKVNAESELEQSAVGTSMAKIRAEIIKSRFGTHGKRVKFDLDMENGLDPYAGLFDILKDYGFILTAASDLEEQIKNKDVPKKSNGWWMFRPWDNELSQGLFKEMQEKGLTKSGKFRENDLKEFCRENEWFRDKVAYLLSSIYDKKLVSTDDIFNSVKGALVDGTPSYLESTNTVDDFDGPSDRATKRKKKSEDNDTQVLKVE